MKVLGIESSCDETSAAVVRDGEQLLSNVVVSQIDIHAEFGGVVPEVAARSHVEVITPVVQKALDEADCTWGDIDAVAVTQGPGLSGSLLIGTLAARTLAITKNIPLYGLHHVEGHVYANFLVDPQPQFPLLALIVSGGHSQLVLFRNHFDYTLLGQTRDDAVGEAFDKVAKIIGLPYPGGPSISKLAPEGEDTAIDLPIATSEFSSWAEYKAAQAKLAKLLDDDESQGEVEQQTDGYQAYPEGAAESSTQRVASSTQSTGGSAAQLQRALKGLGPYDFSFSGLKTATLRAAQAAIGEDYSYPSFKIADRLTDAQRADFAASFQRVAVKTLVNATKKAYEEHSPASVVIAGGVAANQLLRQELATALPISINYAPISLCTDNAAMMAALGYYKAQVAKPDSAYDLGVKPSWSM